MVVAKGRKGIIKFVLKQMHKLYWSGVECYI
jgi:hypothetical protein